MTPGMSGHIDLGAGEKMRMMTACMTTARIRVEISTAMGLSFKPLTKNKYVMTPKATPAKTAPKKLGIFGRDNTWART
jgi:hypothetical protein